MEIKVLTKEEINTLISDKIINLIKSKPKCVLGLATGSSPLGVYDLLGQACKNKIVSFKQVTSFNLDEYYPIDIKNEKSYHSVMQQTLFSKIDINLANTFFPNLDSDYDEQIKKHGGVDLQILGIGRNGHIGFNEPNTPFESKTHEVDLDQTTIADNARFFNNILEVPTKAITMGLATIMNAKEIVLIATGKKKVEPVAKLLSKKITKNFPASILHNHPNVTVYIDKEALGNAKL